MSDEYRFEHPLGEVPGVRLDRRQGRVEKEDLFYDPDAEVVDRENVILGIRCVYRKH